MNCLLKTFSLVTLTTLLLTCATPYQPMSHKGRFEETEIEKDMFQVEFIGKTYANLTTVAGYWDQRIQEICQLRGKFRRS